MFGPLPHETEELLLTIPLRRKAASLFFDKIVLKKKTLIGYFIDNGEAPFYQSALFGNILAFMQRNYPNTQIKENNKKLTLHIQNIRTIGQALSWIDRIFRECNTQ